MRKNVFLKPNGISMIEVITALFIIGLGAVAASTIIISALQGNRVSKEKMIAMNLAREGIEAVRNIRDSNWLRYSATKDECWNFWENPTASPQSLNCDSSSPTKITDEKYYIVQFGRSDLSDSNGIPYTYKYFLTQATEQDKIENIDNSKLTEYELKRVDMLSGVTGKQALFVANNDAGRDLISSPFTYYRQVYIKYLNEDGTDNDETAPVMEVTSKVMWFEKGMKKTVKLQESITNYAE